MTDDSSSSAQEQTLLCWNDLGSGAPTIIALAQLSAAAILSGPRPDAHLPAEARALLFAARERGVMEIKGTNNAFDSIERFLAVYVELQDDRGLVFRSGDDPLITMRFMDAFRQLCAAGLVMHHLYREFSLSRAGFELARSIDEAEVSDLLALASED